MHYQSDILIIGSGAAGLSLALHLANYCQITLLAKNNLNEGSTFHAQGGIAAVMGDDDDVQSHIADTLNVGLGLCDPKVVQFTATQAKMAIQWLRAHGVTFTQETRADGRLDYHLTQEGGHSHRRVIHAADATGQVISTRLTTLVKQHPNIQVFEHHTAIDLIKINNRCVGAYILDNKTNSVDVFQAPFVVLATGGASKVYLYTSNPDGASGDGIAMAWRAGCRVSNMEFNQFHPTCLYHPKAKSFLITEAVRGEGGKLLLPNGNRFMEKYDVRGELAPRDIVARAIDNEMKRSGIPCVYLDISRKSANFIQQHFPNVYQRCLQFGFDITKEPLPVVPAAHYTCGGVVTDLQGRTDIPGLYAIGEVAYTGLHGANRMASNSLLECLVFAAAAAENILKELPLVKFTSKPKSWDESQVTNSDEEIVVTHNWHELRQLMWDYVGIVRTNKRLQRAQHRIDLLKKEIHEYYSYFKVTKNLIELRNLVLVADLIVQSASQRQESRGLHFNLDYPLLEKNPRNTILISQNSSQLAAEYF